MENTNKKGKISRWTVLFLLIIMIIIACVAISNPSGEKGELDGIQQNAEEIDSAEETYKFDLQNGLVITKINGYTGIYMEDATDEEVSDVLMIMVKNTADTPLQYAEIALTGESGDALFKLSTLNPGQTAMVLESERKSYEKAEEYTEASAQHVVFFEEPLTTYEDILEIQPLNGGFNITNISNEDITGEIMVYFKDYADDVLCGGITYRGRIEGGLKAGEVRQIMTDNFTELNTKVMFITITEAEK